MNRFWIKMHDCIRDIYGNMEDDYKWEVKWLI